MGAKKDVSKLGDTEFMTAWSAASKGLEDAKEACRAFSEEHQRRVTEQQAAELADREPSELDQTVGGN